MIDSIYLLSLLYCLEVLSRSKEVIYFVLKIMSIFNKENIHPQTVSTVRQEVQELLGKSPKGEEVDDKLTIANLKEELDETRRKFKRRTFIAGTAGITAGTIASVLVRNIKDRSSGEFNLSDSTRVGKSFENTLNPESQLGENLAHAVNFRWRIAIPYENSQNDIDVIVKSDGIYIPEKITLKKGEKPNINTPMFLGPDKKLYCYLYGIPSNDSGIVEVCIGDNKYNISLESIVPEVGNRTGLFLLEEEIADTQDDLLLNTNDVLENAEILLPNEYKFTVWIPALAFPGTTVINEDRIGIVLSQEQILQEDLLTSELPYILGKSILPVYFSPVSQKSVKPGVFKKIGDFIETYQSQTKIGQLKANGAEFNDEGQIIRYPSYLRALQVASYDSIFTKAGKVNSISSIEDVNDLLAQMYTITSNREYLQKFATWFDNTDSIQRAFTIPLLQKYASLLESMQKSNMKSIAYKNIIEFLSERRINNSSYDSNQRSITQ